MLIFSAFFKDFYYQYTPGEVMQLAEHFKKRVVQIEGTVYRNVIPEDGKIQEVRFIIKDDLGAMLPVRFRGKISPLPKAGEKFRVEGVMKKQHFAARKADRISGD